MIVLVDRSYTTSYQWSIVLYLLWLCGIGFDMFNRVCYLAKILGLARPRPSSLEPGSAPPPPIFKINFYPGPGPRAAQPVKGSNSEHCTAVGKLFHTQAAVELNARPLMVTCSVQGTSSMADDDERRRCRQPTLLAWWSWAVR